MIKIVIFLFKNCKNYLDPLASVSCCSQITFSW